MIGRILAGRYMIVAPIGEGGMSRVWRAQDQNTGKFVAVKVLRDEYRDDETFVKRFEREAQAVSRMSHPNIAALLDVGLEPDGTRYLVIEYISGKTLKKFIEESESIRPETAAQIILRVLAALSHAHQNGVVHRDIKPQNILIDKDGAVKVTDFGIARVAGSNTVRQDTETVMGSVYYFSPEQAKGADVDEKSDIYSVGVMFYELLTRQVPFSGDTPVAIAMKHLEDEPVPPSERNRAVSVAMDFVVLRAMEKRPRDRYVSAAEMMRDIRLAIEHPDTILAARAEMDRMERETRLGEKRRKKIEKRVTWMRRTLVLAFTFLLLGIIGFSGYTITGRLLRERQRTVEVPNVIGLLSNEGIKVLEAAGIQTAVRVDEYPLIAENIIADQSVAPGSFVAPGEVITIIVCKSKYDMTTPNLISMNINTAIKTLTDLKLQSENNYVVDKEFGREDSVIDQDPKPGEPIRIGGVVKLTISAGYVRMPRLINQTLFEAQQLIQAFKLALSETVDTPVTVPELIGKVVNQVPPPDAEVKSNTTVRLEMGVPAGSLHEAVVTVNLSGAIPGMSVTVFVEGEKTPQFSMLAEEGETERDVSLYSQTSRLTEFHVFFDGVLKYTDGVRFE